MPSIEQEQAGFSGLHIFKHSTPSRIAGRLHAKVIMCQFVPVPFFFLPICVQTQILFNGPLFRDVHRRCFRSTSSNCISKVGPVLVMAQSKQFKTFNCHAIQEFIAKVRGKIIHDKPMEEGLQPPSPPPPRIFFKQPLSGK